MALIEVRLRPAGPWRVGHHAGDRERVDVIYHSDALFSAITQAMRVLGWLDEWLDATARGEGAPAVRFSSLFPFIGKTRLIPPPKSAWPPASPGKLYLQGMKLVPLEIARGGAVDEARWTADGASECLVPQGAGSPFHVSLRSAAAVDRLTGAVEPHRTACLEFASNAGWWGLFDAVSPAWEARVKAAFRLLADSGFGGERSRGWGRAAEPSFSTASSLFPDRVGSKAWWLLSLYSPHEGDGVDWSKGEYAAVVRGGWTDSPAGGGQKKSVRMVEEGSVVAAERVWGRAVDVAPDGFPHAVYRSGFALAVPVPEGKVAGGGAPVEVVVEEESGQAEPPVLPSENGFVEEGEVASQGEVRQAEAPVLPSEVGSIEAVSEAAPENGSVEPVSEAAPESGSVEPVSEAAPESGSVEPVSEAAPESDSVEPVSEAAPESGSVEPVSEAAPERDSVEPVSEAAPESDSVAPVSEAAPESDSVEPVSEAAPESGSVEPVNEAAPESGSVEAVSEAVPESGSVETISEAAPESGSVEDASTGGGNEGVEG